VDLIKQYILALTNLYGVVSVTKVVEVYNLQNEEQIDIDDVKFYFYEDLSKDYVYTHKKHFVHETIMLFNDFKSILKKKADKPYYVPNQEELFKYTDMLYYEKPKQYHDLYKYIKKNFFARDIEKAKMLCENIMWKCKDDFKPQEAIELFNTFEVNFKGMDQINDVMHLVIELSNHTRIWENNGYTPNELFEILEKPNLRALPDKPFKSGDSVIDMKKRKQVGRNDPCLCGSGKKYKKCCLGKDEN
jgi:hypothetical protein